jgi:carbon-monoxide dehydrogenase large subunit
VQKAGSAVASAADLLVERARQVAADLLEASAGDVVVDLDGGRGLHVAGTPSRAVGWAQIATALPDDGLRCEAEVEVAASFPSGAYVAVVEVEVDTGLVRLRRLVTVDDAGAILNPLLAAGQVHGGAAQGVAQALLEEFAYDEDANPLTTTFADYPVIGSGELPSFEGSFVETRSPNNPLGAKGIAESGTIGAPPAVQNAVVDALAHLGVRHVDMPCTPERVWRAITAAATSGAAGVATVR